MALEMTRATDRLWKIADIVAPIEEKETERPVVCGRYEK